MSLLLVCLGRAWTAIFIASAVAAGFFLWGWFIYFLASNGNIAFAVLWAFGGLTLSAGAVWLVAMPLALIGEFIAALGGAGHTNESEASGIN